MRFLADECCDFAVVRSPRAAGHDVLAISEFQHHSVDEELLAFALSEDRILLTEDKDFGGLVFAGHSNSPGVILIRFPALARATLGDVIAKFVHERASELAGAFVVLQPGIARISSGPRGAP